MKWILIVPLGEEPLSADILSSAAAALPADPVIVNRVTGTSTDYPPINPVALDAVLEVTIADGTNGQPDYDALVATLAQHDVHVTAAYAVDEVVQVNRAERPWSGGAVPTDAKQVYFPRRKDGTTPEQYLQHWRNTHAPLCRQHHRGMLRYVQHFALARFGAADPTIVGFATVHCPTKEGWVEAMLPDEAAATAIKGDLTKFVGASDAYEVEETVVKSAPDYALIG